MTRRESAGPARHGAGGTGTTDHDHPRPGPGRFTVLYDADCPLCRAARGWLGSRAQVVPLEFLAAGTPAARRRFPDLDHGATLRDLTVIADTGEVYVGDGAWLACLWSLEHYRELADRLAQPHLLPVARRAIAAAAAVRQRTRAPGYGVGDDRPQCADDRCA